MPATRVAPCPGAGRPRSACARGARRPRRPARQPFVDEAGSGEVAREGCLPAGRASVSLGEVACEARDDDSSLPRQPAAPGSARLGSPGRMRCVLVFGVSRGHETRRLPGGGRSGRARLGRCIFPRVFFFGGFALFFPRYPPTLGDEVSSCYNGGRGFDGSMMGSMGCGRYFS